MDDSAFEAAVTAVIEEEGGYTADPRDPGGETKYGISKRAFPEEDIPNLTVERAKELYKRSYWYPLLPYGLSPRYQRIAFESAINQGLTKTRSLVEASKGQLDWFLADRALAYIQDKNFAIYGKGWLRRLFKEALEC